VPLKIHLEFTGLLDVKGATSGTAFDVPESTTVAALLSLLQVRPEHHKFVVPFVNGEQKKLSAALRENDRVLLSLPVGGG
jgi:sulfur carrier protein ThiS